MSMLCLCTTILGQQYGLFKDSRDGKVYNTVKIGEQEWMTGNLHTFYFKNGDPIPIAKNQEEWNSACMNNQPACCYFENSSKEGSIHGVIYNLFAVLDTRGISPSGWHIPRLSEWDMLIDFIGGDDNYLKDSCCWAAYMVEVDCTNCKNWSPEKIAGQTCQKCDDTRKIKITENAAGHDKFRFSAKPSGYRSEYNFRNDGNIIIYWADNSDIYIISNPEVPERGELTIKETFQRFYNGQNSYDQYSKKYNNFFGFYVRCIKD